jgi:hypothetical protein
MPRELDRLILFASMLIPIGFALIVWLNRRRPYPRWAKIASLIGCAAGVGWDVITLVQRPLSIQRYPFLLTVSIKQSLSGVFIGIFIAVALARRSDRDSLTTKTSDLTRHV